MPIDNQHSRQNFDAQEAVRNVLQTVREWGASDEEVCRMLNIDYDRLLRWSVYPPKTLDEESLERIVLVERITSQLEVLFPHNHRRWPQLINNAPVFGGVRPMSLLGTGQIAEIRRIKRWLDGQMN